MDLKEKCEYLGRDGRRCVYDQAHDSERFCSFHEYAYIYNAFNESQTVSGAKVEQGE